MATRQTRRLLVPPAPAALSRAHGALEAAAFLGALLVAFAQGLTVRDLAWSFWFASWTTGSVYLVIGHALPAVTMEGGVFRRVLVVLFFSPLLAFALFHFNGVHYVYALAMDGIIPMVPARAAEPFSIVRMAALAFERYWAVAVLALVHQGPAMVSVPGETDSVKALGVLTVRVYLRALRLHAFIGAMGLLYLVGFESFPVFAVVFLIYFAPSSLRRGLWTWRPWRAEAPPKPPV